MKTFLCSAVVVLCSTMALQAAASLPEGCGPDATHFKAKTEAAVLLGKAPEDKARLVFLQTLDGDFSDAISRFGVDGQWVGATKGRSYFVFDVAPGTHQICASRQSSAKLERENVGALNAKTIGGETYFFQFTIKRSEAGSPTMQVSPTGVPGSSMASKPPATVDSAVFNAQPASSGTALISKLPRSTSSMK